MPLLERWLFTNVLGQTITLHDDSIVGVVPTIRLVGRTGEGSPPVNLYTDRAPGQAGGTLRDVLYDQRDLTLRLVAIAGSLAAAETMWNTIATVLDPTLESRVPVADRALSTGRLTVIRDDGATRCLDAVVVDGLDFDSSAGDWMVLRIPLRLRAPDPYWYDPEDRLLSFGGPGDGLVLPVVLPVYLPRGAALPAIGQPALVRVDGSAPTAPIITLTGPMAQPSAYNLTTGAMLALDQDIPPGGVLTLDGTFGAARADMTAYGTTFDLRGAITDSGDFWELSPGDNMVLLTNEGPGRGGAARLTFRNRYIAL